MVLSCRPTQIFGEFVKMRKHHLTLVLRFCFYAHVLRLGAIKHPHVYVEKVGINRGQIGNLSWVIDWCYDQPPSSSFKVSSQGYGTWPWNFTSWKNVFDVTPNNFRIGDLVLFCTHSIPKRSHEKAVPYAKQELFYDSLNFYPPNATQGLMAYFSCNPAKPD